MIRNRILTFFLLVFFGSLEAFAQLNADFSSDRISGCAPLVVSFADQSTGGATSWSWEFGNGNTSTDQNAGAIYQQPGTYTVKLTVSDGSNSDTETKTAYITVFRSPVAGYQPGAFPVCIGEELSFTDTSILGDAPIAKWTWVFGDGSILDTNTGNVSHAFASGGPFPVSMIITDTNGCVSNTSSIISVFSKSIAQFTPLLSYNCSAPFTVIFTNNSTTNSTTPTYSWDFGDGNTSIQADPRNTYQSPGVYDVTLVVQDGSCTDTTVVQGAVVIQDAQPDFTASDTAVCVGELVVLADTSNFPWITAVWDFGDGDTSTTMPASHIYTTAGTYQVTYSVADSNGCSGTATKNIHVHPKPISNFFADTTYSCSAPLTVNFSDSTSNVISWLWNFGDTTTSTLQNPTHTYTVPGVYDVSLLVETSFGCEDSLTKAAYIDITPPGINFVADTTRGCMPLTVNFGDSTQTNDSIISWFWDFGDGNTSTQQHPTNVYDTVGRYDVTLVIETAGGCRDTLLDTSYIRVGSIPTVDFSNSIDTMCFGDPVDFTDLSSSNVDRWHWEFGDGGTSQQPSPTYVYGDTGTFDVTLNVWHNGCPGTLVKPLLITIWPPKPDFTFTPDCDNYYQVTFTNTSIGADSVVWDFGDGNTEVNNVNTPTHVYASRGIYTVRITAFNDSTGCSYYVEQSLNIAEPIANFTATPLQGCYDLTVAFADSSQDAAAYVWNFGDGNTSTDPAPSHVYTSPGLYTVSVIITDVNNCTDTLEKIDYVNVLGAVPNFAADTTFGCTPLPVLFSDSTVSDSAIVSWVWDFGDGTVDTLMVVGSTSHTYLDTGYYTVSLTVTDINNCTHTHTKIQYIHPTHPYPFLLVDTFACKNEVLTFDASATISEGATYYWDYGDGTLDTTQNATTTHSYGKDSLYAVSLTVVDSNGCDSTVQLNILIQKPVANFGDRILTVGCGLEHVQFTDSSASYIASWNWDLGDGASSTDQHPDYIYTVPGIYSVSLVVTNIAGCSDTITRDSIIVVPGPIGDFTFAPATGCSPLEVTFIASSGNAQQYIWDFGDGNILVTTQDTIVHTYTRDINALPYLILENTLPDGSPCRLPATNLTGNVFVQSLLAVDIPQDTIYLMEGEVEYIGATVTNQLDIPEYLWTPDDQLDCATCDVVAITGTKDDQELLLQILDTAGGGCLAWDSVYIKFIPCDLEVQIPNVFTPNNDGQNDYYIVKDICPQSTFKMTIYNRWGQILFQSDDHEVQWDGFSQTGLICPDGTYYYLIEIDDKDYKGFLLILR